MGFIIGALFLIPALVLRFVFKKTFSNAGFVFVFSLVLTILAMLVLKRLFIHYMSMPFPDSLWGDLYILNTLTFGLGHSVTFVGTILILYEKK